MHIPSRIETALLAVYCAFLLLLCIARLLAGDTFLAILYFAISIIAGWFLRLNVKRDIATRGLRYQRDMLFRALSARLPRSGNQIKVEIPDQNRFVEVKRGRVLPFFKTYFSIRNCEIVDFIDNQSNVAFMASGTQYILVADGGCVRTPFVMPLHYKAGSETLSSFSDTSNQPKATFWRAIKTANKTLPGLRYADYDELEQLNTDLVAPSG